ncbi:MAG: hypothetical protein A3J66_02415 [Candidatus Magasanikbacteria bacterium RIFCSPHIGHO2_02_FULL_47_14]|uniref:Uncharacterized protein n=1 Tax=Candidatus Magasanikbacteria bacterium RIFCSPHIGHO2_02_FULL_47_14 TaxID=1798680 RepID=A0A1F6M1E3_9BACT|nr:MAG: hypothetical protein A3J66_02415 [Candidatus Magasanikbacteria bacterium RIFCSPHIGHO2_02_FULL_47_14]
MKHLPRTIAYITLVAVAVVSVLLYICPFSIPLYTPLAAATVDCDGDSSGTQHLGMSPITGGCFSSHIGAGDDFTATIPKVLGLLLAVALAAVFIRNKYLLPYTYANTGPLVQMRDRHRRYNDLLRFLFENKFRAWLIFQQRIVTAH